MSASSAPLRERPGQRLDKAVRQAIEQKFPRLAEIHLVNYSVRILDENRGTAASPVCSWIRRTAWIPGGSVGVNENVVEASWQALVDSINYGLLRGESWLSGAGDRDRIRAGGGGNCGSSRTTAAVC